MDPALAIFVLLLLATAVMRSIELGVSIRRLSARRGALVPEPRLFPAMVLLHTGLIVLPLAEVWLGHRPFIGWIGGPAAAILVAATALRIWTLATIGEAWNVRVVRPTEQTVVTTGPYRFIRHPNYLCVILEIAALPLLHSAWISALLLSALNAAVLAVRIPTEEATLARLPAWREAMSGRARLIPGLF
ncbi:MAG TPA: hypothetical protein ENK18_19685 [Deltaproteobacteria bacterium]|nr:hypothetical protein [Deltaproteobacteria bacterium]